jgi:hypothetical protein
MENVLNILLTIGIRTLEVLFILGAAGSVLVLVLTTIDDAKVLFSGDEKHPGRTSVEAVPPTATAQLAR